MDAPWAMFSLNGNDDLYTRIFDHNFRMYVRPEDGKIIGLPWDLDRAFQNPISAPLWGDENLQKVIELPTNKRLFYGHLLDIINTTANTDYLTRWASHLGTLAGQNFSAELNYVSTRGRYVLNQLPTEFSFEITTASPLNVGSATVATLRGRAWINARDSRRRERNASGRSVVRRVPGRHDARRRVVRRLAGHRARERLNGDRASPGV